MGVESTIIDLTETPPRLLRPGGVTLEQLEQLLGPVTVDKAVTASIAGDAVVKAPGMKYRHYAPQCKVVIVKGSRQNAANYIHAHYTATDRVLCFGEELELYADCKPLAYGQEADPPPFRQVCSRLCGSWISPGSPPFMPAVPKAADWQEPFKTDWVRPQASA